MSHGLLGSRSQSMIVSQQFTQQVQRFFVAKVFVLRVDVLAPSSPGSAKVNSRLRFQFPVLFLVQLDPVLLQVVVQVVRPQHFGDFDQLVWVVPAQKDVVHSEQLPVIGGLPWSRTRSLWTTSPRSSRRSWSWRAALGLCKLETPLGHCTVWKASSTRWGPNQLAWAVWCPGSQWCFSASHLCGWSLGNGKNQQLSTTGTSSTGSLNHSSVGTPLWSSPHKHTQKPKNS